MGASSTSPSTMPAWRAAVESDPARTASAVAGMATGPSTPP